MQKRGEGTRLAQSPELGIRPAPDRALDMAAADADVAQLTIIHRTQRFDGLAAYQVAGKAVRPVAEQADESAQGARSRGLNCGRIDRGHFTSPVRLQRPSHRR